jgi:asparagine synthase (glutamine-hydrolysing)
MCGITGILSLDPAEPVNTELLRNMTKILDHRGPDAANTIKVGPIGFGHARLKVIDLIGGQQPVVNERSGQALIFNGEIYNFRDLQPAGFQSNSDTETLFEILRFENTDWLNQLNGMFAFAAWDHAAQELLLVRDRVGIKPLHYTIAGNQFLFSSEIKSLLLHPATTRAVNREAIPEYLGFRSIPEPNTAFENIFSVPPGHTLRISARNPQPKIECWWSGGSNPAITAELDLHGTPEDQLEAALGKSIDYRLITDVPVGTYNSGGIDSSLVTALVRARKSDDLHTFSVGFDNERYDESSYADIVTKKYQTKHHKLVVNSREYAELLAETIWHNDTPLTHAHTPQLLALSRLAKEYVTVVLTGEGADETWGGYPRHQIPMLARKLDWVPNSIRSSIVGISRQLNLARVVKLFELTNGFDNALVQANRFATEKQMARAGLAINPDTYRRVLRGTIKNLGLPDLETVLAYDRRTHMMPLLHRLDRTTMASGVEARVPFLDHRIIEWSMTQPPGNKLRLGRDNKILLKKVAEKYFPKEMIYRRKMGFDVPLKEWFREPGELRDQLDLLTDNTFLARDYIDRQGALNLVDDHISGRSDNSEILWGLLNLELWTRMFVTEQTPWLRKRAEHVVPHRDHVIA